MQRRFRLTQSTDFKRVRMVGKSFAHPLVVLVVAPHGPDEIRIGVTAGRRIGGAVERNRAKRLLRESFRTLAPGIRSGWDILAIARQPIVSASLTQILNAVQLLLNRANLSNLPDEHTEFPSD